MTTYSLRRRALVPLAGLLGFALVFAPALTATEEGEKTIYLTVVDKDGKSVTDITSKDILIREDNQDRDVVSVTKATEPLAISILADTSKNAGSVGMMAKSGASKGSAELIQDIRKSLGSFVKAINAASPETQMELMEFGQAAIPVTKMTSNLADLEKGLTRLFPKPDAPSVLLEAIVDASKALSKTMTPRRAIVVLNIEPGEERSRQEAKKMNEELQKSRASLWAISLQVGSNKNEMRGLVLEALTKNTGGRREYIHTQSALEVLLTTFADNLTQQYAVTYRRPANVERANVVQVGVMRQGLGLHASIFAPQ